MHRAERALCLGDGARLGILGRFLKSLPDLAFFRSENGRLLSSSLRVDLPCVFL